MAGGSFFQRVAQWLANEIIVKGLANSPAFQRFAVRSSQQAKEVSKSASEALKNISESENVSQLRKVWNSFLIITIIITTIYISKRLLDDPLNCTDSKRTNCLRLCD